MIKLRPLNDIIIIELDPIMKHEGLIICPEKNSEEKISYFATIVSWGSKCKYQYKVGQRVVIPTVNSMDHETCMNFELDGKPYRFIRECKLHAVLE